MRRFAVGFALVGVLAVASAGQDKEAVEIKIAHPKAGQKAKVTVEDKTTTKTTFTVGGNTQTKDEVKTKSLVYVDDVIENPKNEKRTTKLKRTYEKAVAGTDGNAKTLPVEGKTVLIEKKEDKYTFTADGQPVTGDALRLLDDEFNKAAGPAARDALFPKNAVKPGETWKIDPAEIIKAIGAQGPAFDKDKTTIGGTLVKAYKKDGKQFGVMEIVLDGPITGLGEKSPLKVTEGRMTLKFSGEGCIDGSTPTGTSVAKTSLTLTGTTQGIDLAIAVEGTETRTMEEVKK